MAPAQKLINYGAAAVDEMLDGVVAAHGEKLYIGGGSGHEPTLIVETLTRRWGEEAERA